MPTESKHVPWRWEYRDRVDENNERWPEGIVVTAFDGEVDLCEIPEIGAHAVELADLIVAAPDLSDELLDAYHTHKCGCGHPSCKQCARDTRIAGVLRKAGAMK